MTDPSGYTVSILAKLVAFDTTSHRSNLELIGFAQDHLEHLGARCHRFPSVDGRKANLLATLGPSGSPGIMLAGHSDVVPADPSDWASDPFTLTERDGRYYGRGSADMKGFIAAVLAWAARIVSAELPVPVHIALTYDEEVGCLSAPLLVEQIKAAGLRFSLCIVGEPTGMKIAVGHKGARAYRAHFTGTGGHSSLAPLAVNAVEDAAELVVRLTGLGRTFAAEGPFEDGFEIQHTTVHTGVIKGGTQVNIVPTHCDVDFEFRPIPGADADAIEGQVRHWVEGDIAGQTRRQTTGCGVELSCSYAYPALNTDAAIPAVAMVCALAHCAEPTRIPFGTEAGCYSQGLRVPAVVCGPGHISDAHKPDEFVTAQQLALCDAFLDQLYEALCLRRLSA